MHLVITEKLKHPSLFLIFIKPVLLSLIAGWLLLKYFPQSITFNNLTLSSILIILAALLVFGVWRGVRGTSIARSAYHARLNDSLEASIGSNISYYDFNETSDAYIGISDERVAVLQGGKLISFPISSIRDAWWEVPGWQREIVYGLGPSAIAGAMGAGLRNTAAQIEAARGSGFFLKIAYVEMPIVQFQTKNVKLLQKWEEILRQFIEQNDSEN